MAPNPTLELSQADSAATHNSVDSRAGAYAGHDSGGRNGGGGGGGGSRPSWPMARPTTSRGGGHASPLLRPRQSQGFSSSYGAVTPSPTFSAQHGGGVSPSGVDCTQSPRYDSPASGDRRRLWNTTCGRYSSPNASRRTQSQHQVDAGGLGDLHSMRCREARPCATMGTARGELAPRRPLNSSRRVYGSRDTRSPSRVDTRRYPPPRKAVYALVCSVPGG